MAALRRHSLVIATAAALLLVIAPARAQAQDHVELWGAWAWWSAKDFKDAKPGAALGAAYLADIRWVLDIGGDIGFARFDYNVASLGRVEAISEFQISTVARRWIVERAHVKPFVGARIGYTRLSLDLPDARLEQNGFLAGPVVGIVVPSGRRLSPTISFEALRQDYSDARIFLESEEVPETGGTRWRFLVKAGLTFGSGWKRKVR